MEGNEGKCAQVTKKRGLEVPEAQRQRKASRNVSSKTVQRNMLF